MYLLMWDGSLKGAGRINQESFSRPQGSPAELVTSFDCRGCNEMKLADCERNENFLTTARPIEGRQGRQTVIMARSGSSVLE